MLLLERGGWCNGAEFAMNEVQIQRGDSCWKAALSVTSALFSLSHTHGEMCFSGFMEEGDSQRQVEGSVEVSHNFKCLILVFHTSRGYRLG